MRALDYSPVKTAVGVLVLAAIVVASFVVVGRFAGSGFGVAPSLENPVAVVHEADGTTHVLPLSQDAELRISNELGTNVVCVSAGEVYISKADCDGHDCIRQGHISQPGSQLICLPHQLWVEVRTDDGTGQMDIDAAGNEGGHSGAGSGVGSGADSGAGSGSDSVDTNSR